VDTVAAPFELMGPKDWNRLYNTITLDSENSSKDLTVTLTVELAIGGDDSPLRMKNQVDLSVTLPSTTVSLEILASMRESSLLNFPLSDTTNVFCWLAALESWSPELNDSVANQRSNRVQRLYLSSQSFYVSSFFLDSSCVACSSPGGNAISEVFYELEQAGFAFNFKDQVINLVEEMRWGFWNDFDVDQLLDDAPKYCPHHPEYDPEAKASTHSWPSVDRVSNDFVETIVGIRLIALQSSLIVSAKNQLLLPGNAEGSRGLQSPLLSEDVWLVDWTNLSSDFGGWVDFVFEELRKYLAEPVKESIERNEQVTIRANSLLRDFVLDDEGAHKQR
jgi:hypothetical protein